MRLATSQIDSFEFFYAPDLLGGSQVDSDIAALQIENSIALNAAMTASGTILPFQNDRSNGKLLSGNDIRPLQP